MYFTSLPNSDATNQSHGNKIFHCMPCCLQGDSGIDIKHTIITKSTSCFANPYIQLKWIYSIQLDEMEYSVFIRVTQDKEKDHTSMLSNYREMNKVEI